MIVRARSPGLFRASVLLPWLLLPAAATAATTTATFAVSVAVAATCTIAASPLSFGTYTGVESLATTTLTLVCTNTTTYNVGLSAGSGAGATVSKRLLTGSSAVTMTYSLFRDAARTLNWGNTVGTDTLASTGTGATQVLTVYGRIEKAQYVVPGSYSDSIVATVTY